MTLDEKIQLIDLLIAENPDVTIKDFLLMIGDVYVIKDLSTGVDNGKSCIEMIKNFRCDRDKIKRKSTSKYLRIYRIRT